MPLPHQNKRAVDLTRQVTISWRSGTWLRMVVLGLALAQGFTEEAQPTAEQIAFFESKIRPVLAEHCYKWDERTQALVERKISACQ